MRPRSFIPHIFDAEVRFASVAFRSDKRFNNESLAKEVGFIATFSGKGRASSRVSLPTKFVRTKLFPVSEKGTDRAFREAVNDKAATEVRKVKKAVLIKFS